MKPKVVTIAILTLVVVAALAILVAYNFLYMSVELPDNFIYIGKTINTSELYHPDQFSWYAYEEKHGIAPGYTPANAIMSRSIFIWDNSTLNGNPSPHYRLIHIGINDSGYNLTQINDWYWDPTGTKNILQQFQVIENGAFKNNGSLSDIGPYQKEILNLLYGFRIAPRGIEKITIGSNTYDCQKYYLPRQDINGRGSERTMFWFNDSAPVPVKIWDPIGNVTFELSGWG
ncbi:MAG: hypothetical protein WBZ29_16895 [Methanocella sp.]